MKCLGGGKKKQEPPSKAPYRFLMMLTDSAAGKVQHRPAVKHAATWFHFPSDEPLRRNARFGEEADISGQQVNRDLECWVSFSFAGNKHSPGRKILEEGGIRKSWDLVLAWPLVCFMTLNKSFKCSGPQPFTEVRGSGPTVTKFSFSSEIL